MNKEKQILLFSIVVLILGLVMLIVAQVQLASSDNKVNKEVEKCIEYYEEVLKEREPVILLNRSLPSYEYLVATYLENFSQQ